MIAFENRDRAPLVLTHDPQWLAIVKAAAPYLSLQRQPSYRAADYTPDPHDVARFTAADLRITDDEFHATVPFCNAVSASIPPAVLENRQVAAFYARLEIADPLASKKQTIFIENPDEIEI